MSCLRSKSAISRATFSASSECWNKLINRSSSWNPCLIFKPSKSDVSFSSFVELWSRSWMKFAKSAKFLSATLRFSRKCFCFPSRDFNASSMSFSTLSIANRICSDSLVKNCLQKTISRISSFFEEILDSTDCSFNCACCNSFSDWSIEIRSASQFLRWDFTSWISFSRLWEFLSIAWIFESSASWDSIPSLAKVAFKELRFCFVSSNSELFEAVFFWLFSKWNVNSPKLDLEVWIWSKSTFASWISRSFWAKLFLSSPWSGLGWFIAPQSGQASPWWSKWTCAASPCFCIRISRSFSSFWIVAFWVVNQFSKESSLAGIVLFRTSNFSSIRLTSFVNSCSSDCSLLNWTSRVFQSLAELIRFANCALSVELIFSASVSSSAIFVSNAFWASFLVFIEGCKLSSVEFAASRWVSRDWISMTFFKSRILLSRCGRSWFFFLSSSSSFSRSATSFANSILKRSQSITLTLYFSKSALVSRIRSQTGRRWVLALMNSECSWRCFSISGRWKFKLSLSVLNFSNCWFLARRFSWSRISVSAIFSFCEASVAWVFSSEKWPCFSISTSSEYSSKPCNWVSKRIFCSFTAFRSNPVLKDKSNLSNPKSSFIIFAWSKGFWSMNSRNFPCGIMTVCLKCSFFMPTISSALAEIGSQFPSTLS